MANTKAHAHYGKSKRGKTSRSTDRPLPLHGRLVHLSITPGQWKKLRTDLAKAGSKLAKKLIPRTDTSLLKEIHFRLHPEDFYLHHQS